MVKDVLRSWAPVEEDSPRIKKPRRWVRTGAVEQTSNGRKLGTLRSKKLIALLAALFVGASALAGCGGGEEEQEEQQEQQQDGEQEEEQEEEQEDGGGGY
jgi:uncharacterized protein HemX